MWSSFEERSREIIDLDKVLGLLGWDDETYAPPRARPGRGKQIGTLETIRHQRLTDPRLGELIEGLGNERDPMRVAWLKRVKRRRELAMRVPESLVKALADAKSNALVTWQEARAKDQFKLFEAALARMVELSRERGQALAGGGDAYDALLDELEPGMTAARLKPLFARLKQALVPLVKEISAAKSDDEELFQQNFDDADQWELTLTTLRALGFELDRGRQDRSTHPFSESAGDHDVRVTTRISKNNILNALYSTIHECGHGLYEQGFDPDHYGTELAKAPSIGIHESQSRLWENQIGRSASFWSFFYPLMTQQFPAQLHEYDSDNAYRAVNKVKASFIRVDADELTYNLHIMLRFDLETALIAGDLKVADVPGAWNEKMQNYLGITPPRDSLGCLQDIHWAAAGIGYFPSYTIGNVYAAQLIQKYEADHKSLWSDVEKGELGPLLGWLREKVHRRGQTADADQIISDATGRGLDPEPLINYFDSKYRSLYQLNR